MLSRGAFSMARKGAAPAAPVRGMATAQALRERINSVKNIKKITSAMKMVAVCKLRVAQDNLDLARVFSSGMSELPFKPSEEKEAASHLWIGISSDRGLCGAINSSIVRGVRDSMLASTAEEKSLMLLGEKAKQGLERMFKKNFNFTISEISKFRTATFKQVGEITDYWTATEYDKASVFYQNFKSMISYITTEDVVWSYAAVKDDLAVEFAEYEKEGDADILENLHEFRNACKLYHFFAENETSTLSARMTAMDNSSKNATDMIDSLQLVLNRSRQAKITTELSEIIAGAAAADEQG